VPLHTDARQSGEPGEFNINPLYVRLAQEPVPRHSLPREPMLPGTAAQVVRDELLLDGNARLNLATFVTTWMEPQASYTVFDLTERLRSRGWLVPAYTFPADLTDTAVIRVVIRNGFGRDLADAFLADLDHHWRTLAAHPSDCAPLVPEGKRQNFAH
jgi:glutamate decarboxylase